MKTFQTDPLPPPAKLKLVLKGEVGRIWGYMSGIYKLQPKLVNGYVHWIQKSKSNALWFDKTYFNWRVYRTSDLGESFSAIKGPKYDDNWPQNLCGNWKYSDNDTCTWLDSGEDVVFEEVK